MKMPVSKIAITIDNELVKEIDLLERKSGVWSPENQGFGLHI